MSVWWLSRDGNPLPSMHSGTLDAPLLVESHKAVRARFEARRPGFTPEWTRTDAGDAGVALRDLVLEMHDSLIARTNRWPEKARTEFLDIAGIAPQAGRPASALVTFEVLESLTDSIAIPAGFQVGGAGANGDTVYFETRDTLYAPPLRIESLAAQIDGATAEVKPPQDASQAFEPFGARPAAGAALHIGLSGTANVRESITLLLQALGPDGAPAPVSAGGVEPGRDLPVPVLEWSALDGGTFVTLEVIRDETAALALTGLVELRAPSRWRHGDPAGIGRDQPLRWLRVRLLDGVYSRAPRLASVALNAARVDAGRSIFGENLVAVAGSQRKRFVLSQAPVLPGSVVIEVEEGPSDDVAADDEGRRFRRWQQVDDLSTAGPTDSVFAVDYTSGVVSFGDDRAGRSVPEGFGNVRAVKYRVGGSAAEHLPARGIATLISTTPGVVGVNNQLAASGGSDAESQAAAIRRGPEEIRARGRAVTAADYALYACGVRGAEVARAHAVAAYHADFPGARMPGVVTVFVLTPDRDGGFTIADEGTLRSVSMALTQEVAPAGVVVVAAVPRFQQVSVRVSVDISPDVDPTAAVREVTRALDRHLDPLVGGDGQGWPFGGEIRYDGLVRAVMSVTVKGAAAIRSVRTLDYRVDGRAVNGCNNFAIEPHSLVRPSAHQVVDARNSA